MRFRAGLIALSLFSATAAYAVDESPTTLGDLTTLVSDLDPASIPGITIERPSGVCPVGLHVTYRASGELYCAWLLNENDAHQNFYHSQATVAVLGAAIVQLDPTFRPVLSTEEHAARANPANVGHPLEIYPNSGILPYHSTWADAEIDWEASKLTIFQYWQYLSYLMSMPPQEASCEDLGWGGAQNNQARWKPVSETTGKLVVLLPNDYCDGRSFLASNIRVEDSLGSVLDRGAPRHCGLQNNGRLHWNFGFVSSYGDGPVFLRYDFQGREECRRVDNPRSDLGR